jgi:hypothetical protein
MICKPVASEAAAAQVGEPVTVLPLEAQVYCSISDANWSKAGAHRQHTHLKQSEEFFCRSTDGMSVGFTHDTGCASFRLAVIQAVVSYRTECQS